MFDRTSRGLSIRYVLTTLAYGVGGFVATVTFWRAILLFFGSQPINEPLVFRPDPAATGMISLSLTLVLLLIVASYRFRHEHKDWMKHSLPSFLVGGFIPYAYLFLVILLFGIAF